MTDIFFSPLPPDAPPEPIPALVTSSGKATNPGPAAYSTRTDISNIPQISIHNRFDEKKDVINAPYQNLPTTIGTGKKFTFKGRYSETIEPSPGPEYIPKKFGSDAPSCTVHRRLNNNKVEITPGPSDYDPKRDFGNSQNKITFHGPHERSNYKPDDSPGPAAYEVHSPREKPKITIGHRLSSRSISDGPGPGQYNTPDAIKPNRNKGIIGARFETHTDITGPGPASYETQRPTLEHMPKIYMHGRTQQKQFTNDAPYQNIRSANSSPRYSMRSRYYTSSETTPGVDYAPPAFGKDGRRIAISPRYNKRSSEVTPGPGQYETDGGFGKRARKSTFHGPRDRTLAKVNDGPSPADYSPDYRKLKDRRDGITIGKRCGSERRESTGEYVNLGSTLKGPRFTMGSRPRLEVAYG